MKKIISISLFIALCMMSVNAQLKVESNELIRMNKIVVGSTTVVNNNAAITIEKKNSGTSNPVYGVYSAIQAQNSAPNGSAIGLYGYADNSIGSTYPVPYVGVLGVSNTNSSASSQYGIGVAGLASAYRSVGIYGSIGTQTLPASLSASYAGYFAGSVYVTGTLYALSVSTSDERLKQNVRKIDSRDAISKILQLNPVSYNYKQVEWTDTIVNGNGEKTINISKRFDEKSQEFQKQHYGLLAQELQRIFPDLVYDSGDGYLAVNYSELIPLLIQSMKEQQAQIEELQSGMSQLIEKNTLRSDNSTDDITGIATVFSEAAVLYQNVPNPFSERTTIRYSLPESVKNADIYIFNMQGGIVKKIAATRLGVVEIQGSELQAGMYLYSLVADGKEVDTKRMILTK